MDLRSSLTLEATLIHEGDDSDDSPTIQLEAFLGPTKLFTLVPEEEIPATTWAALATACAKRQTYAHDWAPDNGDMFIIVQESGTVDFTVARYGSGRGGSVEIQLPTAVCTEAFAKASQLTAEFHRT